MMMHNRDLSWLGFNYRVLLEAADKRNPLLERMKFLSIFSGNLDEFFRVRYPSVVALSGLKTKTKIRASIEPTSLITGKIQLEVNRQLVEFGSILTKQVIPELEDNHIYFYYNNGPRPEHVQEIKEIFLSNVLAYIQPVFLDGPPAPVIMPENNQLYLLVTTREPGQSVHRQAIINIPSGRLKRFYQLTALDGNEYVIFLDDIIRENLYCLFPKLEVISAYSFKLNRDAELNLEDEYSGNLLGKIEKQLKKREIGLPSRFLYQYDMPRNLQLFLAAAFDVKYEDMFAGGRYHNLSDLAAFPVSRADLVNKKFTPLTATCVMDTGDIFNVLEKKDVLLHLPYQSYNPVLSFFNQAAVDASVTDIYITLYRLAAESHIVNALIGAAKNGKNVVVFIELKARFDEANNIKWSRMMKEAGIRLVYSMPQIKVHSKTALVKKTADGLQMAYAILSTGNFNEVTAQFYTDHVLITSRPSIISELEQLFGFLQKGHHEISDAKTRFKELLVSPFNLVEELERLINSEIKKAKKGLPARIRIKVNNLEEPAMIAILYKAAAAGVRVELIVRSVCCIVAGKRGEHGNISVRRIVDRFLEHSRLFIFGMPGAETVIMGSSDLMTRNLLHRIEVCITITDTAIKKELTDYFDIQWSDNSKAVEMMPDNHFEKVKQHGSELINAQETIYEYLKNKE